MGEHNKHLRTEMRMHDCTFGAEKIYSIGVVVKLRQNFFYSELYAVQEKGEFDRMAKGTASMHLK